MSRMVYIDIYLAFHVRLRNTNYIPIMLNTMLFLLIITNKDLLNFSKRKIVSVFTNNGINLGKIEPQNSLPLNRNLGKGKKEKVEDARITIEAPSSDTHGETVATTPTL